MGAGGMREAPQAVRDVWTASGVGGVLRWAGLGRATAWPLPEASLRASKTQGLADPRS